MREIRKKRAVAVEVRPGEEVVDAVKRKQEETS